MQIYSQIKTAEIEGHMAVSVSCFLVERGADMALKNQQGKSSLDLITDPRVAELLRKYMK